MQSEESLVAIQSSFNTLTAEVTLVKVIAYGQQLRGGQLIPRVGLNLFLS